MEIETIREMVAEQLQQQEEKFVQIIFQKVQVVGDFAATIQTSQRKINGLENSIQFLKKEIELCTRSEDFTTSINQLKEQLDSFREKAKKDINQASMQFITDRLERAAQDLECQFQKNYISRQENYSEIISVVSTLKEGFEKCFVQDSVYNEFQLSTSAQLELLQSDFEHIKTFVSDFVYKSDKKYTELIQKNDNALSRMDQQLEQMQNVKADKSWVSNLQNLIEKEYVDKKLLNRVIPSYDLILEDREQSQKQIDKFVLIASSLDEQLSLRATKLTVQQIEDRLRAVENSHQQRSNWAQSQIQDILQNDMMRFEAQKKYILDYVRENISEQVASTVVNKFCDEILALDRQVKQIWKVLDKKAFQIDLEFLNKNKPSLQKVGQLLEFFYSLQDYVVELAANCFRWARIGIEFEGEPDSKKKREVQLVTNNFDLLQNWLRKKFLQYQSEVLSLQNDIAFATVTNTNTNTNTSTNITSSQLQGNKTQKSLRQTSTSQHLKTLPTDTSYDNQQSNFEEGAQQQDIRKISNTIDIFEQRSHATSIFGTQPPLTRKTTDAPLQQLEESAMPKVQEQLPMSTLNLQLDSTNVAKQNETRAKTPQPSLKQNYLTIIQREDKFLEHIKQQRNAYRRIVRRNKWQSGNLKPIATQGVEPEIYEQKTIDFKYHHEKNSLLQ